MEWSPIEHQFAPATTLAAMVASGAVSATELLNQSVENYERWNGDVNAVVVERVDHARQMAAVADARRESGAPLGLLHGVPMTIKEVFDWTGTPSTWGDPSLVSYFPEKNATTVDGLLQAGAIIWGKTNNPLMLGDWQSYNDIYGVTNNPWDLERTPGGSSGGSAASLATGMAALEIGSDIGGSIRFPAHYCGVFGHKPSFGMVPQQGHTFPGQAAPIDINVCGPLARSANDLGVAMSVLSDRVMVPAWQTSLSDFRVGVMLDHPFGGEQDTEMTMVLDQAVETLRKGGANLVKEVPVTIDHRRAQELYLLLNNAAMSAIDRAREPSGGVSPLLHSDWIELSNERAVLRHQWEVFFSHIDVLLCPVSASAAPPHQHRPFLDQTIPVNGSPVSIVDQWFWAGIASGSYLPSTVAPVGHTAAGLPIGVQILTSWGQDYRSIRFAELIERELGGFQPPPMCRAATDGSVSDR